VIVKASGGDLVSKATAGGRSKEEKARYNGSELSLPNYSDVAFTFVQQVHVHGGATAPAVICIETFHMFEFRKKFRSERSFACLLPSEIKSWYGQRVCVFVGASDRHDPLVSGQQCVGSRPLICLFCTFATKSRLESLANKCTN
jgi:hypothetical protein